MGYRFTLESANTIANLTFGKVRSCYRDIYRSTESYEGFLYFLNQFHQNIYSNEKEKYYHSIKQILEVIHKIDNYRRPFKNEKVGYHNEYFKIHISILKALSDLSAIFNRCAIKSLLLPRMHDNNICHDDFMTSEDTLRSLYHKHPGDSCLILQPQERPRVVTIFDAFPNFDVALRQADLWPAVMFWDNREGYAFVPIKNEDELHYVYKIVEFERYPIRELRKVAESKKQKNYYLFHLSDLHFGAKNVVIAERRLKSLIKSQFASLEMSDNTSFLITGDAVDSPKDANEDAYQNFSDFLEERCEQKPIRILGNHDVDKRGLSFFFKRTRRIANMAGNYPKIEILKDVKVILLLFNSNTSGNFAQGEIGNRQMAAMGDLLDEVKIKINNFNDYLLIAVMHHHLLPIPLPNFYDEDWYNWYKKFLPLKYHETLECLIDAKLFIEWLKKRNIRFVLHGHKHIPFIMERHGIHIISCGSSTVKITHKEKGKTYISYNILKISDEAVTCTQFVEEIYGAGAKDIRTISINRI